MSKWKKGFSIVELVIALSVIMIVSVSALSIVSSSIVSNARNKAKAEAQSFASDALECFKVATEQGEFVQGLVFCGYDESQLKTVTDGEKRVYEYTEKNKYLARITVGFGEEPSFEILVEDKNGKEIVAFEYNKGGV